MPIVKDKNPFLLKNHVGGYVECYESAKVAYFQVLYLLLVEFPRGFIDLPYFVFKYMGVSIRDAERMFKKYDLFYFDFVDTENQQRKDKLRELLGALLLYSKCAFDESAFSEALYDFDNILIRFNVHDKIITGAFKKEWINLIINGDEETNT